MIPGSNTVLPPSTAVYDLICCYLSGEISEGLLRDILGDRLGWSGDETRAAWADATERGRNFVEAWTSARRSGQPAPILVPPASSDGPPPGSGSRS
jgi:hypothetical protein